MAFGAYDPLVTHAATNLDQDGSVSVACVKGTSANVELSDGGNFSGGTRRMSNGTDFLNYDLYTTRWPHHGLEHDQPGQLRRGKQGVDEP